MAGILELERMRRSTVRKYNNPYDKSSIVSIFPKRIEEKKPTLQPNTYILEPGTYENPSILVVNGASWWREIDPEQPLLEIPVPSPTLADSIVTDYISATLYANISDTHPGIFWVPGEYDVPKLKKEHKPLLDVAQARQKNWFMTLVKNADSLWARTGGNPLAIPDDARMAAQHLALNKEWIKDYQHLELVKCIACGSMRNPEYPICFNCKTVVDTDLAKKLGLVK